MNYNNRACQFLPFNGLRGFDNLIEQAETPKIEKREITEDHARVLNEQISTLRKGDLVKIIYYTPAGYVTRKCKIVEINIYLRYLRTQTDCLSFNDLWSIEPLV